MLFVLLIIICKRINLNFYAENLDILKIITIFAMAFSEKFALTIILMVCTHVMDYTEIIFKVF